MPMPDGSGWFLNYVDSRSDTRMLVSMPALMLRDLQLLAKSRDTSAAELVRRAVTREVAELIRERPQLAASFRGTLADG